VKEFPFQIQQKAYLVSPKKIQKGNLKVFFKKTEHVSF
jgi:hypothetical protein